MTQFHEGQDVEVNSEHVDLPRWEKATINLQFSHNLKEGFFEVKFSDGTIGFFHEDNIRPAEET